MIIKIELSEIEIRRILASYVNNEFGISISAEELPIQVKSKQNYKSEWEEANIKVFVSIIK